MQRKDSSAGRTRVSDAVLDKVVLTAAREVRGVVDITGLARGAVVGGLIGGAVGFAGAGAGGAAMGAPVGGAVGAAAAHWAQRRKPAFNATDETPDVQVHLSARYGADLVRVAQAARERIRDATRAMAGMELGTIEIVFTRVVPPSEYGARSR